MMKSNYGWMGAVLSLGMLTVTGTPAQAADLIGQCRAAKQVTGIYEKPVTTSKSVGSLKMNDRVTLAENTAKEGMIAVNVPMDGFVKTSDLKMCGTKAPETPTDKPKPADKPTGSTCRLVTQVKGLVIRNSAGGAEVLGGVSQNDKITLASPMESKDTADGRTWIKISKPMDGWVSEGFKNAGKNVSACP
jgi:hypothetical protein